MKVKEIDKMLGEIEPISRRDKVISNLEVLERKGIISHERKEELQGICYPNEVNLKWAEKHSK